MRDERKIEEDDAGRCDSIKAIEEPNPPTHHGCPQAKELLHYNHSMVMMVNISRSSSNHHSRRRMEGKATVALIDEYLLRGLSVTEGSVRHGTTNLFPSHPYLPKHLTQNKEI